MLFKLIFLPVLIASSSRLKQATEWMKQAVVDVVEFTNEVRDEIISSKHVLEDLRHSPDGGVRALIHGATYALDLVMSEQIQDMIRPEDFYYLGDLSHRIDMLVNSCGVVREPFDLLISRSSLDLVASQIETLISNWSTLFNKGKLIRARLAESSLNGLVRISRDEAFNVVRTTTAAPAAIPEMSIEEALLFIEGDKPPPNKSTKKKTVKKAGRAIKNGTLTTTQQITTVSFTTLTEAPTTTTTMKPSTRTTKATTTRTTSRRPTTRTTRTTTRATTARRTTTQRASTAARTTTPTEQRVPVEMILQRGKQLPALITTSSIETTKTTTVTLTTTQVVTTTNTVPDMRGMNGGDDSVEILGPSIVGQVTVIRQPVVNIVTQIWEVSEAIMGLSEQFRTSMGHADSLIPADIPLRASFDACKPHIHNAHMATMNMVLSVRGLRDFVNLLPVYAVPSYAVVPQIEQRYLRERREELDSVPIVVPSVPLTPVLTEIRDLCAGMVRLVEQLAPLRTQACAVAPDHAVVGNICHCSGAMLQAQTAIDNMRMAVNTLIQTFNEYGAGPADQQYGENVSSRNTDS